MTEPTIQWYLEIIKGELEKLKAGNFTGNIQFKVNMKQGGICNIDIGLNKSVKMFTDGR